ncbi:MAG: hypothetical protein R3A51_03450 [Nannocystaceae bacterium]
MSLENDEPENSLADVAIRKIGASVSATLVVLAKSLYRYRSNRRCTNAGNNACDAVHDGNYFKQGNLYFRYGPKKRGWFSLPELHAILEKYVAGKTKTLIETTKIRCALV